MEEGKTILVGNETDLLHCGYSYPIKDNGKRFPSAVHYCHFTILKQLGVDDLIVEELLCTNSNEVAAKAHQILLENMPQGHTIQSLASYLESSRNAYTHQALQLRAKQDKEFATALLNTNDSLIIVCDPRDREYGIGMDDKTFLDWLAKEKADSRQLSFWMKNEHQKPADIGNNKLGTILMLLRHSVRLDNKTALLTREVVEVDGISIDKDDKPMKMSINDLVIALHGIFRPLSNYYAHSFEMKGERYRSVEHYAYEKLFNALKLDDKMVEKIQTTVSPLDVYLVAEKVFRLLKISPEQIQEKTAKMDRWRQSAMKHKIVHNDYLQQLLLSTGHSILIDCSIGDPLWTCGASEAEVQRLLTKTYVTPEKLVNWMRGNGENGATPKSLQCLYGNKTGLLLMELRERFSPQTQSRIPLITPFNLGPHSAIVTHNVICFTPESVWHPLYPAEIRPAPDQPLLRSPAHYIATQAIKHLGINSNDSAYILETESSLECWNRLHETIEEKSRGLMEEQDWWMEKRPKFIKDALQLLLEQHPAVLRALLDTGDAHLIFCSRFSSIDAELSIGMRECDLRVWLNEVDLTNKMLMELCCRPMAFRPPYLGGNRLGLILMELRRNFVLKGIFPQTLQELQIGVDTILGSDSPTENMITTEYFDVLQPWNYTALWINPLILLAKSGNTEAINACNRIKLAPRLVTVDDEKISEIVDKIIEEANRTNSEPDLSDIAPEDLRAVFMKLCSKLLTQLETLDRQNMEMQMIACEAHRLQAIRRSLADTRDKDAGVEGLTQGPPLPSGLGPQGRIAAGRERDNYEDMYEEIVEKPRPVVKKETRVEYKIPTMRKFGRDREKKESTASSSSSFSRTAQKRTFSPIRHEKRSTPIAEKKSTPIAPKQVTPTPKPAAAAPTPVETPKVPKPKRDPNEELSDGEILSTDEEDNS